MQSREIRKLVLFTGINGLSITLVAGLAVLLSVLFAFTWSGLITGLAIAGFGTLELKGCLELRSGRLSGLDWARKSQLGVLVSLFAYCLYQLYSLTAESAFEQVSPASREILMQLYAVDQEVLGDLLELVGRITYSSVMLAALAYQGGLYWYYGRKQSRLGEAARAGGLSPEAAWTGPAHPGGLVKTPYLVTRPTIVEAAGTKPKRIEEYIGRANSGTAAVSMARMNSPAGWIEPGQTPEFDEYTLVLRGTLRVTHRTGFMDVVAGQAVICRRGEWVQYSTPVDGGAEYVAVCLPAFSSETVHRDG